MLFKHINDFIVHDGDPLFSDGHSVLELVLHTILIVGTGTHSCISPGVKRTVVRWEHSKRTQFQCALSSNTDGFDKVNTQLDNVLTNISEATTESVKELVASVNDLFLNGGKECNLLKIQQCGKQNTTKTHIYIRIGFVADCNDKRNAFSRTRRRYKDNKSDENLEQMKQVGKEYKTIVNKSKAVQRHKFVEELKAKESNDLKAFWPIINKNTKQVNTGNVS